MAKLKIIMILVSVLTTLVSIKYIRSLLINSNIIRPNYRGDMIPVCMGMVFLPSVIINIIITMLFFPQYMSTDFFVYAVVVVSMLLVGLLDDLVGETDIKGLKGHFKALFKGRLTTGGLKALTGGVIGIMASAYVGGNYYDIIIGAIIMALSTNFMNLLDLRPGRAIKVYFLFTVILLFMVSSDARLISLLLLPSVIVYFILDLKAYAMMGDAGSNVLGVSLGFVAVLGLSSVAKLILLIFLLAIHVITEKYSLTEIIEKNNILNRIDLWGRRRYAEQKNWNSSRNQKRN